MKANRLFDYSLLRSALGMMLLLPVVSAQAQHIVAEGDIDDVPATFEIITSQGPLMGDMPPMPVAIGDTWRVVVDLGTNPELTNLFDWSTIIPGATGFTAVYDVSAMVTIEFNGQPYVSGSQTVSVQVANDVDNPSVPGPNDLWLISPTVPSFGPCAQDSVVTISWRDTTATMFDNTNFQPVDPQAVTDGTLSATIAPEDPNNPGVCFSVLVSAFSGATDGFGYFGDVLTTHWAAEYILALAQSGVTSGCNSTDFCPDALMTRAQMAVFLERGINGAGFTPPAAAGNVFTDVPANAFAAAFIEQLRLDGITSGCSAMLYCPNDSVTRAQMAVFLLRAIHGSAYVPPAPTGQFGDVTVSHWAAGWIEQLAAEAITGGCGSGNFCPESAVTRAQMAVFLVRAFGL